MYLRTEGQHTQNLVCLNYSIFLRECKPMNIKNKSQSFCDSQLTAYKDRCFYGNSENDCG